jgi:hypothetical protein
MQFLVKTPTLVVVVAFIAFLPTYKDIDVKFMIMKKKLFMILYYKTSLSQKCWNYFNINMDISDINSPQEICTLTTRFMIDFQL